MLTEEQRIDALMEFARQDGGIRRFENAAGIRYAAFTRNSSRKKRRRITDYCYSTDTCMSKALYYIHADLVAAHAKELDRIWRAAQEAKRVLPLAEVRKQQLTQGE